MLGLKAKISTCTFFGSLRGELFCDFYCGWASGFGRYGNLLWKLERVMVCDAVGNSRGMGLE